MTPSPIQAFAYMNVSVTQQAILYSLIVSSRSLPGLNPNY